MRDLPILTALVLATLLPTGCSVRSRVPPEGRPCSDRVPCGPGTTCDPQSSTCVTATGDVGVTPDHSPPADRGTADLGDLGPVADQQSGPTMQVDQTTSEVSVTVPGRFKLVFDAAHEWQAAAWYDLSTDPGQTQSLGGNSASAELKHRVVQSPVGLMTSGWKVIGWTQDPSLTVVHKGATSATLESRWHWDDTGGVRIDARALHTIQSDGLWTVTLEVSTPSSTGVTIAEVEYAFTNVELGLGWDAKHQTNLFRFERNSGATPRPIIEVSRGSGATAAHFTENPGNQYWAFKTNHALSSSQPFSLAWTNRIWGLSP